jgi:septation ring formation regulator EzrA
MPLPPEIDKRIRQRFEDLSKEVEQLITDMERADDQKRDRARQNRVAIVGALQLCEDSFFSLRTKVLSLIEMLSGNSQYMQKLADEVRELESKIAQAKILKGIIDGLKEDYEEGMLENMTSLIEANIAADYLGQAEQLLKEGQPGQYDHVPAAVLTGAILEDALRRLCQRQIPPITVTTSKSTPKTLNPLIDDLKKAGLFNELKAKQFRAWADIRNAAAHGQFDEFNRTDVEQMLAGVQNFLADCL